MNILDSQLESNIVDDILIEICTYLDFEQLLELQLLSKYNKEIIRKTRWDHAEVNIKNNGDIDERVIYIVNNFNFGLYDLSGCTKITDKSVKMLGNCHELYLSLCYQITDKTVKTLGNCCILDLTFCFKITDESVKTLSNCHILYLCESNNITNLCIKNLREKGVHVILY